MRVARAAYSQRTLQVFPARAGSPHRCILSRAVSRIARLNWPAACKMPHRSTRRGPYAGPRFATRRPASALSLASPSGVCRRERGRAVRKKQRPPPLPPFPSCRIRPRGREYAVFGGNSRPVSEPLVLSLASNTRVGSLTLRQLTPATYGVQLIWYETSTNSP